MLPLKIKIGVALALFLLCSNSYTASAVGDFRSNVFQDGPLNCYHCSGVAECAASNGIIRKCENNAEQTCVTVFDTTGAVTQRACSDSVQEYSSYCNSNPERCPACSSSGCNVATSLDQYVECVSCDSALDKNCIQQPNAITTKESCYTTCMTALYPSSGTKGNYNYRLVRSCLYDRDLDDRTACLEGSDDKCVACTSPSCNVHVLPETRHTCYRCEGGDCEDPEVEECLIYKEDDQCYMLFDEETNDPVQMGCASDFDDDNAVVELVKQKLLILCDGENCNGFENFPVPHECTKCSSDSNVVCATNPTVATSYDRCVTFPYTQCYQLVTGSSGGLTQRGCLSELEGDEFYNCLTGANANCKICTGDSCNKEVIPPNRQKCQRCSSANNANCQSTPNSEEVCPLYLQEDSCVAHYSNGVTERGCLTEIICDTNTPNCQICKDDSCNNVDLQKHVEEEVYGIFQDLPLSCLNCTGAECATGGQTSQCTGYRYQDCLTVFDTTGQVVRRGCELEVLSEYQAHCDANAELCFNCKSNGCNTITNAGSYQSCLSCEGNQNSDCVLNPSAITSRRKCTEGCLTALYARKGDSSVSDLVRGCVEDFEQADRETCRTAELCTKCSTSNCNNDKMPASGRMSCWHCEGDNCDEPVQQECIGYSLTDQCYIYFDSVTYSAVRSGCKSEYTALQLQQEVKQFFLCDGDNCNSYSNLPDAKVCYSCNSAQNEYCATNPNEIPADASERCQIHPFTDCYTRVSNDGHTQRGCLQSLAVNDFVECQADETGVRCQVCGETGCNKQLFPADRLQCYRCNSADSADCDTSPSNSGVCPLYQEGEHCVTKFVNGVTYRGCGTEFNCDNSDHNSCQTCEGNNCNTVDLSAENIGPPGLFQGLPLNCYHCSNALECGGSSLGLVKRCEGDITQTCSTAFASNGSVVARGCSHSLNDACAGNTCYECKSNGCNLAREESEYLDCIFCEGKNNLACITDVPAVGRSRKCYKNCMTALYPRTEDEGAAYELIRTCLDDMDLDDREDCEAGNNDNCKACNSERCNTADLGERISCYHCEGDNCQSPEEHTCATVMDNDQCYVQFDETGTLVQMGCKSQYDPPEIKLLVTAKRLWLCDGDNCNAIDNLPASHRCSLCSSRTDANCAQAPSNVISTTACSALPYTECYSRVLENGHTERGCLNSLEDAQFYNCLYGLNTTECTICTGDSCNKQVHPPERQSCHVCNSANDASCSNVPASEQICLLYNSEQQCVTHVDGAGNTVRGCSTQLSCDPADPSSCQYCPDSNCNSLNIRRKADGKPGLWQDLPLSCYSCSGADECVDNFAVQTCSGAEYCMTVFDASGRAVQRGCSETVEAAQAAYCDANSENCHNCNSNMCNAATSASDYVDCLYCDTESNEFCVSQPSEISFHRKCYKQCMTALYPRSGSSGVYELTRSCLDDKESADQQTCAAGGDMLCAACTTDNCNTALLPETRRSCYSCTGEDCEDPQIAQCRYYKEDDECFILFDNENDVTRMGCVSDLPDNYVDNNFRLVFTCSGDNCNSFSAIPLPQACAECNSFVDEVCASEPHNTPYVVECTALPHTQCYTRVLSDGSNRRGCLSDLINLQMINCLNSNSTDCTTCVGDRCNIDIFPADRRRCHRCNSKEDPTCESAPESESVCPFYSAGEFCSSKIVNGYTYRGCSSDFTCDDTNKQYCRMCHDQDNCNVIDLASLQIGYPGNWQDVPINCYTCVGSECQGSSTGVVRKCEGTTQQNCATVFATNGTVVQRGCSNLIYASDNGIYCDENPDQCKFCKSNGCNSANSLNDYVDCVFCNGAEDKNCVSDVAAITRTRSCNQQCFTGLYPRTKDSNPAYELSRGCLDDLDLDDREACVSGNKENCKACTGTTCNKDSIPATRLQCYECKDEDECKSPVSYTCSAYRENDQCFSLFDHSSPEFEESNKVVRMGCASDLDADELHSDRRALFLCDGDNCNTEANYPAYQSCYYCNSTSDPNCASNPASLGVSAGCTELPHIGCFTRVNANGVTSRGCYSDLSDADFDDCLSGSSTKCETCTSNNCNNQMYPENRRSCLRCDSEVDADCAANPQAYNSICPIYQENDSCVTTVAGDRTQRGCASDFTCNPASTSTCRVCDSDNCNQVNLLALYVGTPGRWQDLPLNCFVCEGAAECAVSAPLHRCENNNAQNCMTVFENNAVVGRGCSDTVQANHGDHCEAHPEQCYTCKSNGCNNANSQQDYSDCFFCDSGTSGTCATELSSSARTRKCLGSCMVALFPRTSNENTSYLTSRSCLDDMDLDDRDACIAGQLEYCKACEGDRCNDYILPEDRHECYKCLGDECESPTSKQCSAYHPNDQCYTIFDDDNSIISMGCRSEYETDVVTALIKQKQMLLCDGKNCNAQSSAPTAKECSVCNSDVDPRCATNPNLVENTERCSALPYTDCYTRINSRGNTERGCLSDLETEIFYGCVTKEDGLCETCMGDKCNEIDVYPANRQKCHQCNSLTDPSCSSAPNSNSVCPYYAANDACVTNLRNGVTTRGCSSSMRCDNESDKHTCRTCSASGCNTVDLEKVSESGEPGKWQDVPINCYACKGETECVSNGLVGVCQGDPFQSCLTVFNEDGKVVQRGCRDAVDQSSYCNENPDKCLACNSNGCNVANALTEYIECLTCDTDANGNCVSDVASITKTRMCYKHCMTALYPRNDEENPSYGLARNCYDDMDLDDRDACEAGDNENCRVCSTNKCNTENMPDVQRLSCYQCAGDGCQDPKAATCPTYRPDDKCFAQYDEKRAIVSLGCRSEFSNADADYMVRQKRLYLCDSDNCNDFDSLPVSHTCKLCSSRTDVACATTPASVSSQTTCAVTPYTECYSRVLSDGATERGCLSNLYDDEFLSCLNGTSTSCQACTGDVCNNQLFPTDRLSCHICDSSTDASCETSPNHLGVCPIYDEPETCVTTYRNDVTYRGCGSSLVCDVTNPRTCVVCSGEGCNSVNLAEKQDDNFGKWQDLPLTCLSCSGTDCNSEATTEHLTCENNNEQDCVTVFDVNGNVVRRGCADALDAEYVTYCSTNADNCYNCKSNECNTATAKSQYNDCIYCDSHKNTDCVLDPLNSAHRTRKCQGSCMSALYVSVDTETNPIYDLIRTCLNDKEPADQNSCSAGTDDTCKACTGANCNTDLVPTNRHQCYICSGEDCEDPVSKACPLYREDDQCYIWFDETNDISEMGCLSSFRNQDINNILKTKRVLVCEGENCNTLNTLPQVHKCAVCDSKDNPYCATNALEVGTFDTCSEMPYTSCYSKLASDGSTARGCLSSLPGDDFVGCLTGTDDKCGVCSGDGCNREIFPADRQQCYTCTSEDDVNCESFPTRLLACPTVADSESCRTSLGNNVTVRGCSSEVYCDTTDSSTCRSCYGTGCNSIDLRNKVNDGYYGYWQSLPLRCHTCEGSHCRASLGPAVACTGNVEQDCMTVFNATGEVIRRGCENQVEDYEDRYCRENPQLCFKCKSNECNAAWELSEYVQCIYCNSDNDTLCATNPQNGGFATRACYQECMVAMQRSTLIRSCLDDKELFTQSVCRANESGQECASCDSDLCNNFVYPADRLKCHVCTGSSCSSSTTQYCAEYETNDFCFAKYDNGNIDFMGCGSSQSSEDINSWTQQNQLYRCDTSDCNEINRLPTEGVCVSCDSSKSPNCAQNPSEVQTTETCAPPNNECLTRIDSVGNTLRGCANSLSQSEQNSCIGQGSCAVCIGSRCNAEVFPANRRKCHICNSVADPECFKTPDAPLICPVYKANDRCVTKNTDNFIERGCESELTCDTTDEDHCQICDTDNCNVADLSDAAVYVTGSLMLTMLLAFVATIALKRH